MSILTYRDLVMPTVDYKLLETQDKRIEFGGEKITN